MNRLALFEERIVCSVVYKISHAIRVEGSHPCQSKDMPYSPFVSSFIPFLLPYHPHVLSLLFQ